MSTSTVTVVVPAYNAAATLASTLRSALEQDRPPDAIVVVDDGSTDETASIAASFAPDVRCITTPNRGVAQARNVAIAASDSTYVAFLDADDLWLPSKLGRQLEELDATPSTGLSYTGFEVVDDELRHTRDVAAVQRDDYTAALLHQCEIAISSVVVRRDVLDRAGAFHPWFSQCADWECWLRLSRITPFTALPEPLIRYRSGEHNMSRNIHRLEEDSRAVFDSFYAHRVDPRHAALRRAAYGHNWVVLSGSYLHAGDVRAAARCLARAALTHPPSLAYAARLPLRRWRRT